MKLLVFGISLILGFTLFSSCKKCVTCSYSAPGIKPYTGDYCSKKSKDITTFKKLVSDDAQRYGTTAQCVDKDK